MQKHRDITLRRLELFVGEGGLRKRLYPARQAVQLEVYSAPDRVDWATAAAAEYRPCELGEWFKPLWSTHWFRVAGEIPAAWAGTEVHFLFDAGAEACVWIDGQPRQGLTGGVGGGAATRPEFVLTRSAAGGEAVALHVEMAVNTLFGVAGSNGQSLTATCGHLRQAEIAVFDREAWGLLWDMAIIVEMARHLPETTPRAGQALAVANRMANVCELDNPETWTEAREIAKAFLSQQNGGGQHNLSAVGHAHIDSAWLWPVAETKRKCYRTFSTALRNMEEYPDYQFVLSQAAQWEWMKDMQPGLYKQMCARAREGRFIPTGGSWVEPDCNIPSGESLVRQFLLGQRYFEEAFGTRCGEFWNPDVFGYSAQLPQILKGVGIDYFLTQKLSWNQFNKLPSHTFLWEGLDGSRVLTHFPPADTYNATAVVKELVHNVANYRDHERGKESYMLFGYGDGGGGPTREMLERVARMADVDGLPRMEMRSPAAFFERLERDIEDPTVWIGELYFEFHRGTYTTQAKNKLYNRQGEFLLREVEMLGAIGHALGRHAYPAEALLPLWKSLLFNQFHDIIPGSSINAVYRDSDADYAVILAEGETLRQAADAALIGAATASGSANTTATVSPGSPAAAASTVRALNTLAIARREVAELPAALGAAPGAQRAASGQALAIVSAPAIGAQVQAPATALPDGTTAASITETTTGWTLENDTLRAELTRDGRLARLLDKRCDREVLVGPGNNLVLFDDTPNQYEAWDVEVFHLEKRWDVGAPDAVRIVESGPLRVALELDYPVGKASRLTQTIRLDALSARLDFACVVDWQERRRFLKVEFPVNVRCFQASYEVQFGHVQRPTHFNNSWDLARFEVCAHRWADLSEPDYGVALLNDCKYGYAVHGNVMRLSLLRGSMSPDPEADLGEQRFAYALYPHLGGLAASGVVHEGLRFNVPLRLSPSTAPASRHSWFQLDNDAVILDTIKRAEDSDHLVLRLYETLGTRGHVTVTSPLPIRAARRCNMLEDDGPALDWHDRGVQVPIAPFEVLTLKLEIGR